MKKFEQSTEDSNQEKMVGILQFFDIGQACSSCKSLMLSSRRNNGLEAPRNTLEFPMKMYQSFQVVHEEILHGTDTERLIAEEIPQITKDQCNRPSVVARLMGMDALPSDIKPLPCAEQLNDEKAPRKELSTTSNQQASLALKSMRYSNTELFPYNIKQDFDQHTRKLEMNKPQTCEHPQEELLQKFKREFEAWKASKVWEKSVTLELGNDHEKKKYISTLPQEGVEKEKVTGHVDHKRSSFVMKTTETRWHVPTARPNMNQEQDDLLKYEAFASEHNENALTEENSPRDNRRSSFFAPQYDHRMNMSASPRRIVILKPCYEMYHKTEESLGSRVMVDKEKNMHDFLEQVKERLIVELQWKPRFETATDWTRPEAFVTKGFADSKYLVPKCLKQNRGYSEDNKATLMRPKSTRTYRNEIQPSEKAYPEIIDQEMITPLSERVKNVLKDETDIRYPFNSSSRLTMSLSSKEAEKFNLIQQFGKKVTSWDDTKALIGSKSFKQDQGHAFDDGEESSRNLVRSFSAPVSGIAFGKLLLEDKHSMTSVHTCRKHEVSQNDLMEARKNKNGAFVDMKSRVTCLRQTFTLKEKLFRKRIQLMDELAEDEFPFMKTTENTPSVLMNLGFAQDNSTEVPPSPASVCHSSHDDNCRPYYPSPVFPLEALLHEDYPSLTASREPNLPESSLSEEFKNDRSGDITDEIKPAKDELLELESNAKAYVREILFRSGLFNRNHFDQVLLESDTLMKPISMSVFHEVEETYRRNGKLECMAFLVHNGQVDLGHRILFDLLNEALLRVVQNSKPHSTVKKWFPGCRRLPHGNQLLDSLWHQIQLYINPHVDESYPTKSIVAQALNRTPWSGMLQDNIDVICVEMEFSVAEILIDEFVCDLSY